MFYSGNEIVGNYGKFYIAVISVHSLISLNFP